MGTTYQTYVGPYVRCRVGTVEVTETRIACIKEDCPNHIRPPFSGKFCNLCGSPMDEVEYTETKDAVDSWDVSEAFEERLTTASGDGYWRWSRKERAHIWHTNVPTEGRDYHLEEMEDFSLVEIKPGQIQEEVTQFEQFFAEELATLRTHYGPAAVSLHWGTVQDYS